MVFGIDQRGDQYLVALAEENSGHRRVVSLLSLDRSEIKSYDFSKASEIVLAVPDRQVFVKHMSNPATGWRISGDIARFELMLSLLDSENLYRYDTVLNQPGKPGLGLLARAEELSQWTVTVLGCRQLPAPVQHQMRAVALGRGFLKFCHREDPEPVCVVDFNGDAASMALVLNESIADVTCFSTPQCSPDDKSQVSRLITELKTLIDFRAAALPGQSDGVRAPKVIVSGNPELRKAIQERLGFSVGEPRVMSHLIGIQPASPPSIAENFLAALGLTVK